MNKNERKISLLWLKIQHHNIDKGSLFIVSQGMPKTKINKNNKLNETENITPYKKTND